MDGLTDAGRSFMDEVEKLVRRVERLERCARHALLSAREFLPNLKAKKVREYLDSLVLRDEKVPVYSESKWSTGSYTGYYKHYPEHTEFEVKDQYYDHNAGEREQLYDILLDIAVLEQMTIMRLLVEIDPTLMSAVDACASVVAE